MSSKEIEKTNKSFVQAFNRGNIEDAASVYTTDARILPPNSEMLKGRENIKAFWQGAVDMGVHDVALETMELTQEGDAFVEIGKYSLKVKTGSGEPISDNGSYVVIWKQEGGSWKWHIDIWNTDLPLPE